MSVLLQDLSKCIKVIHKSEIKSFEGGICKFYNTL